MNPAADEAISTAIRAHADAYGLSEDDEMLSDYAIIAHWQRIEDDGRSRYTLHLPRMSVPNHIVVGLFTIGISLIVDDGSDES